ncbi:MAG: heme NO-binding domain-containing protein [Proteobacteria bacterium]|nr:heme NO-binding domain-containing protein [Pseudomonadota bacterium]
MKGIVFVEYLQMVEEVFSEELAFEMITNCDLPSGGSYTRVGTYDFSEMQQMVGELSRLTEMPVNDLLNAFGKHLFGVFHKSYPQFFEAVSNSFEMLEQVHDVIHEEVKKLYPDAQLPSFAYNHPNEETLEMVYSSSRRLSPFALGLIQSCIAHFKEDIEVNVEALPDSDEGEEQTRFVLSRR